MSINPDDSDGLLDRAVRALRELAVTDGPPAEVVEKVRLAGATAAPRLPDLIERVQTASDTRSSTSVLVHTLSFDRIKLLRPRHLAAIACAGLLVMLGTQLLPIHPSSNFAFAQVLERVRKTKSVQYNETFTRTMPDGNARRAMFAQVKIIGDRLKRMESHVPMKHDQNGVQDSLGQWGHSIEITDVSQKKKAILHPDIKGYTIMDWRATLAGAYAVTTGEQENVGHAAAGVYAVPAEEQDIVAEEAVPAGVEINSLERRQNTEKKARVNIAAKSLNGGEFNWALATPVPQLDIYELARLVPADRANKLGEKVINGTRAVGFLVEQEDKHVKGAMKWRHIWWVNPATMLPIQLKINWQSDGKDDGAENVFSDILFDAPIDPTLFSIDLPPGYTDIGSAAKEAVQPNAARH